jgi:hypothetical protein
LTLPTREVPSAEGESDAPSNLQASPFARPMKMHTERGEIYYRPFAGSRSQLVPARQLGRSRFAIEKSVPVDISGEFGQPCDHQCMLTIGDDLEIQL